TTDIYTLSLHDALPIFTRHLPKSIPQTGDKGYKLKDVYEQKIDLETFIAQLSDEDLAAIVRGEGMNSPWVTPGTAAAFGGITDRSEEHTSELQSRENLV